MNIIFIGRFSFPVGMAGTQIVMHFLNYCIEKTIKVKVVTIQERIKKKSDNPFSGTHNGIKYKNLGVITGNRVFDILLYPANLFYFSLLLLIWKDKTKKNILFVYDSIFIFNILPIVIARLIGYKVVIEVVEDYQFMEDNRSFHHNLNIQATLLFEKHLPLFADKLVVISRYLENKFQNLFGQKLPIIFNSSDSK